MVGSTTNSDWDADDIAALLAPATGATFADGASLGIDTTDATSGFTLSDVADTSSTASLGLTVLGGNTLTLSGTNAYRGPTNVLAGMLDAASPGALPGYDLPGQISVASGATLAVMVGGTSDWDSIACPNTIATLLGNADFSAGASLGLDTSDLASGSFAYPGQIVDTPNGQLGLVVLGDKTLALNEADTYSGPTVVNEGTTLDVDSTSALPASTVVSVDGSLNLLNSACSNVAIAGLAGSGTVAFDGQHLTIDASTSQTFGGTLDGDTNSKLIIDGSGTQVLGADNSSSFSGTINVGPDDEGATLEAQLPTALGSATDNFSNVTVEDGATLAVMVGGSDEWNSSNDDIGALVNGSAHADFQPGSSLGIDASHAPSGGYTCTSIIGNPGGSLGLAVLGDNSLTLAPTGGVNSYTGGTTIAAGATLVAGSSGAIPSGPLNVNGTLDLAGSNLTATSLNGNGEIDLAPPRLPWAADLARYVQRHDRRRGRLDRRRRRPDVHARRDQRLHRSNDGRGRPARLGKPPDGSPERRKRRAGHRHGFTLAGDDRIRPRRRTGRFELPVRRLGRRLDRGQSGEPQTYLEGNQQCRHGDFGNGQRFHFLAV